MIQSLLNHFSRRGTKILVLSELVEAQGEYIKLLERELSEAAIFSSVHGMGDNIAAYAEGCALRGNIEELYDKHRELGGVRFTHIDEMKNK